MTVLSTTGAASLKRSGFMSFKNVLYNYYHTDLNGQIYGSNTMGGGKKLLKYDDVLPFSQNNFIFAKDELIAGPHFGSYTGGKNWNVWAQSDIYSSGSPRGGLNGIGAYRPANDTVVMGYVNQVGGGIVSRGLYVIKADGTVTTYNFDDPVSSYTFGGIVYSPTLDAFFWYDSANVVRVYSGVSPGTQLTSGNVGNLNPYSMSISSDGYPLAVNATGFPTVYTLRKVTDTSLSYTNLGTITDSQRLGSTTFVWDAARSRYCKASYVSGPDNVTLYFGYSSDALTWTNTTIGSIADGTLVEGLTVFLDGSDIYVQGKHIGGLITPFQRVSTDGGATWSVGGANGYSLSTKRIVT